jgi:hypothetical protein
VAQPSIAHRESLLTELFHHGADDASPSQDHLGAFGLETDDRPTTLRVLRPICLDLAVGLVPVQDRPLDHVGVIGLQPVTDRSDVGPAPPIATRASGGGRLSLAETVGTLAVYLLAERNTGLRWPRRCC